ncbi:IDEAL domain-containing protein [Fredinandcohnia onubensis]|uniref:IDEAL domain-containing protein n=1 Tax=Fredinandcohnia onubensis TaxID=1571209 RepID=UPI000C0C10A8|nr:IDEAL domain-containing protein [Fredinandcohnia onubensis]
MNHFNKEQKNEVVVISQTPDEEMYEKVAEMVLIQSQASFRKEQLLKQIDQSLINKDETLFMELTKQYNTLLSQHSFLQ